MRKRWTVQRRNCDRSPLPVRRDEELPAQNFRPSVMKTPAMRVDLRGAPVVMHVVAIARRAVDRRSADWNSVPFGHGHVALHLSELLFLHARWCLRILRQTLHARQHQLAQFSALCSEAGGHRSIAGKCRFLRLLRLKENLRITLWARHRGQTL